MKFAFAKARWKWLRLVLVVMLPLHVGFAQATMVMPTQATADAVPMADGMPCHHAETSPAPDHPSGHQPGCCDAGSCHCAAACGLAVTISRIAPQVAFFEPSFTFQSVPSKVRPPDLRPPIS